MTSKIKVKEKEQAQPRKEECRHFWVIEVANGPISRGQCKYCGAKKEFYNAFPEFNPLKKGANPFSLPKLHHVPVKEDN
ncbi:MAG TPA: hypothetical protein VMB24_04265 [Dehalococcoidales bacterium]|nr:hypothetical protein [Dehalococcoidales bacterium]